LRALARFPVQHPWVVLGLTLALTAGLGLGLVRTEIVNDIKQFLPEKHAERIYYDQVEELFGNTDVILIGLEADDIFARPVLEQIVRITKTLEANPHIEEVTSLANVDNIVGKAGTLEVAKLLSDYKVPESPDELAELKRAAMSWEVYVGALVSRSGKQACVVARGKEESHYAEVYDDVLAVVERERERGPAELYLSGVEPIFALTDMWVLSDVEALIPLVFVVVLLCLAMSFRNIRGVVLPTLTVGLSTLWTVGLMGWLGVPLSITTSVMPVLLIGVGSAYGIHVVNAFLEGVTEGKSRRELAGDAVLRVGPAVAMAGLTTVAGFGSLATNELKPIREFGIFTAVGVGFALFVSLTFLPAALTLWRKPKAREEHRGDASGWETRLLGALGRGVHRRRLLVFVGATIFVILAVVGSLGIRVDSNMIEYFPEDSEIRRADDWINRSLGGTTVMNVVFESEEMDRMKNPKVLQLMVDLQDWLKKNEQEGVGHTMSIADYVRRMYMALDDGNPESYRIPDSREAVAQLYLLLQGDTSFDEVVTDEQDRARVTVQLRTGSSIFIEGLIERVQAFLAERIKTAGIEGVRAHVSGTAVLVVVANTVILEGQLWSLLTSIIAIFFITTLIFRSLAGGLYSVLPLVLTLTAQYAMMGFLGVALNVGTVMCASVAVGIGVDYAIHQIHRYRRELHLAPDGNREEVAMRTARTAGRAIVYNGVAVTFGFLVLLFSNFLTMRDFGWLVALTMVVSGVAAMTLLPALFGAFRSKFLERG